MNLDNFIFGKGERPPFSTPGWNFVGIPIQPQDNKISSVLSKLTYGTDYDQVSRYNPQTESFEHYVADKKYNHFNTFDYGVGYQVYIKNPQGIDLTVSGISPEKTLTVYPSWNQIGTTSFSRETKAQFLDNLAEHIDYDKLKE